MISKRQKIIIITGILKATFHLRDQYNAKKCFPSVKNKYFLKIDQEEEKYSKKKH